MKKLSNEQILSILTLSEYEPSIESASISNANGSVFVNIHSVANASNNDCDAALAIIFPEAEYDKTKIHINDDGSFYEHMRIAVPEGVHVSLFMCRSAGQKEKTPASTGAEKNIFHIEHNTNAWICEDTTGKYEAEKIIEMEWYENV